MPSNYVSKFALNDQEVIVKDSEARTAAATASTNATNALNKVTELENLSRVEVAYTQETETISITAGTHTVG